MEYKLTLLNKILMNSRLVLNDDPDDQVDDQDTTTETKRKAERNPNSNESNLDIKQVLDLVSKTQAQLDKLLEEKKEEENKRQETKEKVEKDGTEKSTEAIYDIVRQELEEIKKENKRVKEESEIKDYRNEIMESKPWLKDSFKDLLSKGGLASKKEIDNAVTMLDDLLKEKWDEAQNAQLAGKSVEEISNMAKSGKSQESKKLTEEEEKEAQKETYRKNYEKKYFVVYD